MIDTHRVFKSDADAIATVEALEDGEDFTYVVIADPTGTGKAIIAVCDMSGQFIHYL